MCGYGGSKRKDDCNQAAHLQYCIFVELKFFNKLQIMLEKVIKKTVHFCRGFYVHECSSYT
jgi:hypothetical protein